MRKRNLVLVFFLASVLCLTLPAAAQKGFGGNWEWHGAMNRQKQQTAVWIDIKQTGNKVRGSIWFNQLVDGDADGSDASAVPFIGTVNGNVMTIEFDSEDVRSIDEENIRYRKPRGKPDAAVLRLQNGKLEWQQTYGSFNVGLTIPKRMTLRRNR